MSGSDGRPRLLLVGGGGGLIGRSALAEMISKGFQIRSLHRHGVPSEATRGVEWVPGDINSVADWAPLLDGVDVVLNLAWYRIGGEQLFAPLYKGLARLMATASELGTPRFLHVSVPPGPPGLESRLPYFTYKRKLDRALEASGLSYAIVRPTMIFAPGDKLLGVMMRLMNRYRLFPMFGDGEYRLSPVASTDVARLLSSLAADRWSGTVDVGGPVSYRYRELTDLMWESLGKRPRYVPLSPWSARTVSRLFEGLGSSLIYEYEVEWLMADLLGLPPCYRLPGPLERVEPYLDQVAETLTGRPRRP
ncbi:MAG: SDR family oxidoreductase [Candidatus Lutacidiplasmatales archaeon]